jgi:hypothetical protein
MTKESLRLHNALRDIADHFDDQGFPPHEKCNVVLVNYAYAVVYLGYDGYMADWYEEFSKGKEFQNFLDTGIIVE